jgi:hypothetical protein
MNLYKEANQSDLHESTAAEENMRHGEMLLQFVEDNYVSTIYQQRSVTYQYFSIR